jgi:hypothetical protein
VVADGDEFGDPGKLADAVQPAERLAPSSDGLVMGRFVRGDRRVLLVLNAATSAYSGSLITESAAAWTALDPSTASVTAAANSQGRIAIELGPRQAVVLMENAAP